MHIVKNCLHYPSLKNLNFLKQYNYLQLYIHLCLKEMTMELWFQFLNMYNAF